MAAANFDQRGKGQLYMDSYGHFDRAENYHFSKFKCPYTEPYLSGSEWSLNILGSSLLGNIVARPLAHLDRFGFLMYSPADMGMADKRPMLFETILTSKWFKSYDGRTIPMLWSSQAANIGAYHLTYYQLRNQEFNWLSSGFLAGAVAGVCHSLVLYPWEVLLSTAKASKGTRGEMKGIREVLMTAIQKKPQVLRNIYSGYLPVFFGSMLQGTIAWGGYNVCKYDAAHKGQTWLVGYIWLWQVLGYFALYPFQQVKTMHRQANHALRYSKVGYPELLHEVWKRYGSLYLFKGAFNINPFLIVTPAVFSIYFTDFFARGYTEINYPERKRSNNVSEVYFVMAEEKYNQVRKAMGTPGAVSSFRSDLDNMARPTGEARVAAEKAQDIHNARSRGEQKPTE